MATVNVRTYDEIYDSYRAKTVTPPEQWDSIRWAGYYDRSAGKPRSWIAVNGSLTIEELRDAAKAHLTTQVRDLGKLSPSERRFLYEFGQKPKSTQPEELQKRENDLLAQCSYVDAAGILEFDVERESSEYLDLVARLGEDEAKKVCATKTAALLRQLAPYLQPWFNLSKSFRSNNRGGLHVELFWVAGFGHVQAMRALRDKVREACRLSGVPYLGGFGLTRPRADRPAVFLDDSTLNRGPAGRGSFWRLEGVAKDEGGFEKESVAILPETEPTRSFDEVVEQFLALNQSQLPSDLTREKEAETEAKIEAAIERERKRSMSGASIGPLADYDLVWIQSNARMNRIWKNASDPTQSRVGLPFKIADAAIQQGADYDRMLRLVYNRPGSSESGPLGVRTAQIMVKRAIQRQEIRRWARSAKPNVENLLEKLIVAGESKGKAARALRRIKNCGVAENLLACTGCDNKRLKTMVQRWRINCDSFACAWCSRRYVLNHSTFVKANWPDKLWVSVEQLKDESLATALKARERRRNVKKRAGRNYRDVIGPGLIVHFSSKSFDTYGLIVGRDEREVTREEAEAIVTTVMTKRCALVQAAIKAENADLALGWLTSNVHVSSSGRGRDGVEVGGAGPLPWPKANEGKKARREDEWAGMTDDEKASEEEAFLSPCCGLPHCYHLVRAGDDKPIATSIRPFGYYHVSKFKVPPPGSDSGGGRLVGATKWVPWNAPDEPVEAVASSTPP